MMKSRRTRAHVYLVDARKRHALLLAALWSLVSIACIENAQISSAYSMYDNNLK